MITSNNYVFLHIPKTGGTLVNKLLKQQFGGRIVKTGVHHDSIVPDSISKRLIFSGVRDPYQWYVSLWWYWNNRIPEGYDENFEVITPGIIYTTHKSVIEFFVMNQEKSKTVNLFPEFYKLLHSIDVYQYDDMNIPVKGNGFFSETIKGMASKSISDDSLFYRLESIRNDVVRLLLESGENIDPEKKKIMDSFLGKKRNYSEYDRSYKEFYTKEVADLIRERDEEVFDRFGYDKELMRSGRGV